MEHEIYVPFSPVVVRSALTDPERAARCVPGLQPAPDGEAIAPGARLRVRIGGSTITYRGSLAVAESGEGFTVEGEGTEARGTGAVRLTLTVVPRPVADGSGTTLSFNGTVEGKGRLTEFEPRQRIAAARRLLDRFTEALVEELGRDAPGGIGEPDDNERAIPGIPAPESPPEPASADELAAGLHQEGLPQEDLSEPAMSEPAADLPMSPAEEVTPEPAESADSPPEADAARRTMIGRSAEEVDHAPPRGRYAPELAPGSAAASNERLRWAAPVAALAALSALAIARLLRRRRTP